MRRALQRPGCRRLFAAQTVSRWGDTFNSLALVILVYQLLRSQSTTGWLSAWKKTVSATLSPRQPSSS